MDQVSQKRQVKTRTGTQDVLGTSGPEYLPWPKDQDTRRVIVSRGTSLPGDTNQITRQQWQWFKNY